MATVYGRIENRGGKRKLVRRDKPIYQPLKNDGEDGRGERPRSCLGGIRKRRLRRHTWG